VSRQTYDSCIHGRSCTVTYLPSNPKIHCLGPAAPRLETHNHTANLVALVLALGFAFMLAWVELSARGELRLARFGERTEGRIVERASSKGKNRTTYSVRYLIDTPQRTGLTGWVTVTQPLWERLHAGAIVSVLYDPDHPRRHRPSFGFHYVQFLAEPLAE
jgi:hypothetical protein